jgi:NAD(P)-dependent dehydrogenase (short-subunit alcohol dehydrogenase family)
MLLPCFFDIHSPKSCLTRKYEWVCLIAPFIQLFEFFQYRISQRDAARPIGSAAEDLSFQDRQRMIDVNLTGVFLCAQAVGKNMIEQGIKGSIINISSICGHIVVIPQKQCHYNASKGGVGMLTKSLAAEWADHGIRVNAISPGYIKTKIIDFAKELHPIWIEKIPMKTIGQPKDIAEAVLYLASPKSKYVTGADSPNPCRCLEIEEAKHCSFQCRDEEKF